MRLSLCALEIVLGNPGVRVDSENRLYYFIANWTYSNYKHLRHQDWQKVESRRLFRFIHFPYLSHQTAMQLARRHQSDSRDYAITDACFLIKEFPYNEGTLSSDGIYIKKIGCHFCLLARCAKVKGSDHFGLFLWKFNSMPDGVEFDYEFAVLTSKDEYRTMVNDEKCSFSNEVHVGNENLLGVTWAELMAQDSEFLVDGTLHLRAKITITTTPPKCPFFYSKK